eukprot:6210481-Pleurochrysis_carterae.AAC.1
MEVCASSSTGVLPSTSTTCESIMLCVHNRSGHGVLTCARLAVEFGVNVLQTDTDVVWLANPYPALKVRATSGRAFQRLARCTCTPSCKRVSARNVALVLICCVFVPVTVRISVGFGNANCRAFGSLHARNDVFLAFTMPVSQGAYASQQLVVMQDR